MSAPTNRRLQHDPLPTPRGRAVMRDISGGSMEQELKACPKCGEEMGPIIAWIRQRGEVVGYDVTCFDCGFSGPQKPIRNDAIAAWNTRTGEQA